MTRYIILSLLLVCFICIFQAYGAPSDQKDDAASDAAKNIEAAWSNVKDTLEKGFEQIRPGLEKFGGDTKDFISKTAERFGQEAQKIIPKTD